MKNRYKPGTFLNFLSDKTSPATWFDSDFNRLKDQEKTTSRYIKFDTEDFQYCLHDRTKITQIDRHYLYHPAWAAQIIAFTKPEKHIDISSIIHFGAVLSAFVPIEFYDYRPVDIDLNNYFTSKADLTNLFFKNNSVHSLSCMHTVEHIGLGRYGDPIDYDGDLKAMQELARVLEVGGNLLFVVPVGKQNKICFNAHRIYTADFIRQNFEKYGLIIKEFTYISQDTGGLVKTDIEYFKTLEEYGCGCFWLTK